MKKLHLICLTALIILFEPFAYADDDSGHRGHGWGHHHHYYREQPEVIYYYPQPEIRYYQPPVRYYQQPRYSGYDQRSIEGLAGGVIGGVFGYELGNGNPLSTGIGAAAGSYFGNEVNEINEDDRRRW